MVPRTVSAGQEAHHATTSTLFPISVKMFHNAGTFRTRDEIGTFWPVEGSFTRKSTTPCSSGLRPVATVVHKSGDRIGWSDLRLAQADRALRRARTGSFPCRIHGSISC